MNYKNCIITCTFVGLESLLNKFMESIQYIERNSGDILEEHVPSKGMLKWLYSSLLGKASLHLLFKRKIFSALGGWYMNTRLSKKRIDNFILANKIDLSNYIISDSKLYKHFNDFFYRKIKAEIRPIANGIVSPADGKLLAFQTIKDVNSFFVKGSEFTVESFLHDKELADKYADGAMLIVRLAPADYHRFHFPADGKISKSKRIKGNYFSVSPLALRKNLEIFCQNHRVYSTLSTNNFGEILICEVGATLVGSIIQTTAENTHVKSGDEKGYFAFGGSTIVLLFEKGKVNLAQDLLDNTKNGLETSIMMGESITQ